MTGTCKLCKNSKKLCQSHVVPEQCYRPLYDEKHRLGELRPGREPTAWMQKGIREYLFCADCEDRLNVYESAFADYWFKRPLPCVPVDAEGVRINGFDYAAFKLFHLSILWRASFSKHALFRAVSLGRYQEKMRDMIWSGGAGPEEHFPIIGVLLVDREDGGAIRNDLITPFMPAKLYNCYVYSACYAGCEWLWFVTDHPNHEVEKLAAFSPRQDGTMLLRARRWKESLGVRGFLDRARKHR